jgi:hypothetical protein
MLNVAIAVDSATDYGPQAVQVVAAACEEVIGAQRCPVADDLPPGAVAAWYAVVHPNDRALSSVRVEFRDRTADGVLIEERSLTFSAHDTQRSRLISVGSVIAALAAAREGVVLRDKPVPPPPSPPLPPARLDQPLPVEAPTPDWSVDVAALAASTFGDGPYRVGGLGRAQFGLFGRSFVLVAARYAQHPGNPSFDWWTVSAGVGTRLGERASVFNLELSGELLFQYTSINAERDSERESAGQAGWGGRLGVGAMWATWRHCSVILGLDGTVVVPRINLIVGNDDVTHVPLTTLGLYLGLRFQP